MPRRNIWTDFEIIGLQADRLPNLASISARLAPTHRMEFHAGQRLSYRRRRFLRCWRRAAFPPPPGCAASESLEYTPEPDIFHDVFGHVPMHAHKVFADFLRALRPRLRRIEDAAVLEKLGRLFWYTVEFGVIRQRDEIKVYGSGLISSHGECQNVIDGHCAIHDFSLDEVLKTPVKVDELHKLLFAVSSFDQIYEAMHEAERRAISGSL